MLSLHKILLPTDLSPNGDRALAEAKRFASVFSSSVDLLYVWAPPALVAPEAVVSGIGLTEQPLIEWLGAQANEQLGKLASEARAAGLPVGECFCDLGDPASAIIDRASKGKYDLLVLGTHGRTGLSHLLLGSVAAKVVREAPCPVLTVRTAN